MVNHQFEDLPTHLSERIRVHSESSNENGRFVLYWMRTAVRADENPALEVAIRLADQQRLPLLVYQAISQHHDYASDRHHMFMLEGARDVQMQFLHRGISYAFHLATRDDCGSHLKTLAEQATMVVTEEMPVDPPRRFLKALTSQVSTPVICVDTACVVPMRLLKRHYTRAFEFRSATSKLYSERLTRAWPNMNLAVRSCDLSTLPFQSIDLQAADLPELVSRCEIDHSVGRVFDTQGGSTAGYARWNRFLQTGIGRYAARRNNALVDGVSRMSAYLHYGMVSPMRVAREAAAIKGEAGEKYLDELLIWRELAYAFCFHRADHDQWSAIPEWAQTSLQTHSDDPRPELYSWEQLARAQTNDAFWNAAQTSLLRQGELHNNVRMTWGKTILNWTKLPQDALNILIDLNHRYALDGRDPASFGGLLWCLGQFDRPFEPEAKILGTVRPRSTKEHARRLDTESYRTRVATPRFDPVPRVAVIGAGISGLCAARTLADHGLPVIVFDKGHDVGGRMSSRRLEGDDGHVTFDHGAQYFTARDPRFRRYVDSWLQQGVVAIWPNSESDPSHKIVEITHGRVLEKPDTNERFVGSPAMNAVCRHLATDLNVQTQTQVGRIESVADGIRLSDEAGRMLGTFQRVIVSAPAPQTVDLLIDFPELAQPISKIQMQPCWAVMASFEQPITSEWVGAFIHDSVLTWVARNSTKPNRSSSPSNAEHLVLHAGHKWTAENWERSRDEVAQKLLAAFWRDSGVPPQSPLHLNAHRWKYAIPVDPTSERCFFDAESGIAACGDWAGGPRVEGAFLSGMAAAGRILGTLSMKRNTTASQLKLF
jgi:photolyase PhrII